MEENEFYRQLVQRYAENGSSEEELEIFFHLLDAGKLDAHLVAVMNEAGDLAGADPVTEEFAADTAGISISRPGRISITRRIPQWARVAVAAILIALFTGSIWMFLKRPGKITGNPGTDVAIAPIAPAIKKAILILANGTTVVLDSAQTGVLGRQGNTIVRKSAGGSLVYSLGEDAAILPKTGMVYNTVTTPRGGQYEVVLPDRSRVWLNAASSLRFPTAFNSMERRVEISGEAYFEIAKDPSRPFRVSFSSTLSGNAAPSGNARSSGNAAPADKSKGEVEVLGTDFNVMDYADETEIKTTLIRGAVRVINGPSSLRLQPGEQALIPQDTHAANAGPVSLIHNADTSAAIAWTTGFFQFRELDLPSIMRQVSRWYDVDIIYDVPSARLTSRHFGGRISRRLNLSDVLPILEAYKIHFRTQGTTIHVLP